MVSVFLWGGVSISTLVHQAQLKQTCYQPALREPNNGNRQQLHFVPDFIQKVEWDIPGDRQWVGDTGQSVLQSFGRTKQLSWWWLHTFLSPQSCWMRWDPHATACVQGTYVICSSKGIQWCWGMYQLRCEIKWVVMEWTGTLVAFSHTYNDCDRINC